MRLGEPAKRGGHGAGISSAELHPIFHPPTSITRFTGYLSKLTLGAYLVSWIPDNYLYTMLKSAVPSVTDQLNYFPLTVGGTILVSLLLAAVVECCVSLLMRLLRRSAKVRTAGTAQA